MSKVKRAREFLDSLVIAAAPLTCWTAVWFHWPCSKEGITHADHGFQRWKTELELEVGERHKRNERHGVKFSVVTSDRDIDIQSSLCS